MTYDGDGHPCPGCGASTGYTLCVPCQNVRAIQSLTKEDHR